LRFQRFSRPQQLVGYGPAGRLNSYTIRLEGSLLTGLHEIWEASPLVMKVDAIVKVGEDAGDAFQRPYDSVHGAVNVRGF
jgi:hypothetical protein